MCRRKASRCMGGVSACLLVLFGVAMAARLLLVPALAKGSVDSATITFGDVVLSRGNVSYAHGLATAMHGPVRLAAEVMVDGGGLMGVQLRSFRASFGADGQEFAYCDFPALHLDRSKLTRARLDTELHVTNDTLFAAKVARLLKGHGDEWDLSGTSTATSMTYDVNSFDVRTKVVLPGNMVGEVPGAGLNNIEIVSGGETTLRLAADLSFFSTGVLQLRNMSKTVFWLHPRDENGTAIVGVRLGTVTVPNFELSRGPNTLRRVSAELIRTEISRPWLGEFLGGFVSGVPQAVSLRGPVGADGAEPTLLEGLVADVLHIRGPTQGFIKSVSMSAARALQGYNPMTGWPCLPGLPCFRGPVVALESNLNRAMKLSDIVLDVNLTQDLSYGVTYPPKMFPRSANCTHGRRLLRLRSKPGMWTYMDGNRSQDASAVLPAAPTSGLGALMSLFLPMEPQPSEAEGPASRCFHTALTAAACSLRERDLSVAPVEVRGSMYLEVDAFKLAVTVSQGGVPVTFADDMQQLKVGPGPIKMMCSGFDFRTGPLHLAKTSVLQM